MTKKPSAGSRSRSPHTASLIRTTVSGRTPGRSPLPVAPCPGYGSPRRERRGGALSQLHLALVMGRRVAHDLLARADGPRRERRGGALSQLHLALVMGGSIPHDLLARADGPRRERR